MTTFLFDRIIFGPVISRRLGISLGVNVLHNDSKFCNYDCVYCECGWSNNNKSKNLPSLDTIINELEKYLLSISVNSTIPDVITFAGNGEPTLHPEFLNIINNTISLRDKYIPNVKIAVLSNGTNLANPKVVEGLNKIDLPILKIDVLSQCEYQLLNRPFGNITINNIVDSIKLKINKPVIQTMFLKGKIDGYLFDNTSKKSLEQYFETIKEISPDLVMIYSIARDTPMSGLQNIDVSKLQEIGEKISKMGIQTLITP